VSLPRLKKGRSFTAEKVFDANLENRALRSKIEQVQTRRSEHAKEAKKKFESPSQRNRRKKMREIQAENLRFLEKLKRTESDYNKKGMDKHAKRAFRLAEMVAMNE